jgi:hypothetical protein
MTLAVGSGIGSYEILSPLGVGGMRESGDPVISEWAIGW